MDAITCENKMTLTFGCSCHNRFKYIIRFPSLVPVFSTHQCSKFCSSILSFVVWYFQVSKLARITRKKREGMEGEGVMEGQKMEGFILEWHRYFLLSDSF